MAILQNIDASGIATVTLNRPDVHNAFDDKFITELTKVLKTLGADNKVRLVILAAAGKSFSAGADLEWMKRMSGYSAAQNTQDAQGLADLMFTLNTLPKPTIAKVQGSAYGGGVGLVACCDIAVAVEEALFSLSETRLGLIPAVISPYVIAAIGERAARRYFLTAERFSAGEAWRIGLVHETVEADELNGAVDEIAGALLECGPQALGACKEFIRTIKGRPIDKNLISETAERIAAIRSSDEGKEGIGAFLEKRAPKWVKKRA